jgi:arylsulfatase A-like enzyme
MIRRTFIFSGLLSLLAATTGEARPPNIVFIYTDDQAAWAFGAEGNPQARTPHMNRLAGEGMVFDNAFSVTPVCSPARAGLLTGQYASRHGILDFIPPPQHDWHRPERPIGLSPEVSAFPRVLASVGYDTALIGKFHLGDWTADPERRFHPTRFGYRHFTGLTGGGTKPRDPELEKDGLIRRFEGLTDDILASEAITWLEERAARQSTAAPFLLSLHFRAPHHEWLPVAAEDWQPYQSLDPDLPQADYPGLDTERLKTMMRQYLAATTGLDRNLGRMLETLDRLGLAGETVVIFTSDHGYNMGHHGIWHKGNGIWATRPLPPASSHVERRYRPNLFDESLRVPLIVRWPGIVAAGSRSARTTTNLDWFPTLLEMAGVDAPDNHKPDGRSLVPILRGMPHDDWSDDLYLEYSMLNYGRAYLRGYRTPEWKLVLDLMDPTRNELYHLAKDPEENHNLFSSRREDASAARRDLRQHIISRMKHLHDPLLEYGHGLFSHPKR